MIAPPATDLCDRCTMPGACEHGNCPTCGCRYCAGEGMTRRWVL